MAGIQIDGANQKLYLDSDADTYFEAATDDTIKVYVAGAHDLTISANAINVLSGTTLTIDSGATITNSGTASGFVSADPSSADGDTLGTASLEWSDLYLADSSVVYFGADQDTTLTHTDGTGLTLNSTNKLCFNDVSQFVQGISGTVLGLGATDEIDLTATAIDINGTADVSGAFTAGSTIVATGSITGTTIEPNADTSSGDNAAIGYTASEGLILTGQGSTDDVTIKNDADTTVLQVATGGVDVEITAGNIIMGTSGKGIDFAATGDTSASGAATTSELFDDYEEGTWTMTLVTGSGTATINASYDTAYYTKIGRHVYVYGAFQVESVSSPSGGCQVHTLPFAVKSSTGGLAERAGGGLSAWDLTGTLTVAPNIWTGGDYTYLVIQDNALTSDDIANHIKASSEFRIGIAYMT